MTSEDKMMELLKHGEYVGQSHSSAAVESKKTVGTKIKEGKISGLVSRFDKRKKAADIVMALGMIKRTFPDAIEYTAIPSSFRGVILLLATFGAVACGYFAYDLIFLYLENPEPNVLDAIFGLFGVLFFIAGAYLMLFAARYELFQPDDEPVIFDRKNNKIYRIVRVIYPGLAGLFRSWPVHAAEYNWRLVEAEHHATLVADGTTATRHHSLLFFVHKDGKSGQIIDSFNVIRSSYLGELNVAPVWEHMRRFMEADGPHLPDGEEVTPAPPAPTSLWQSLGVVGPFGPNYFKFWKKSGFATALYHAILPVSLPMFLLWGFYNWISYKTQRKTQWPQEVIDAVQSTAAIATPQ